MANTSRILGRAVGVKINQTSKMDESFAWKSIIHVVVAETGGMTWNVIMVPSS